MAELKYSYPLCIILIQCDSGCHGNQVTKKVLLVGRMQRYLFPVPRYCMDLCLCCYPVSFLLILILLMVVSFVPPEEEGQSVHSEKVLGYFKEKLSAQDLLSQVCVLHMLVL